MWHTIFVISGKPSIETTLTWQTDYSLTLTMKQETFTILVIDDDPEDLEIFCDAIERLGSPLECRPMTKCSVALTQLAANEIQPQLILLDAYLTDMDAIECLRQLKKYKQLSDVPVAIFGEPGYKHFRTEASALTKIYYFQKPGLIDDLVEIIKSILPAELHLHHT